MSRIKERDTRGARRGFTLVEILVASSLAAILMASVLTAYLFLGRNLTRLVNFQNQEVESRAALRYFTTDVGAGIRLTTATAAVLALTKPAASGTTAVTYTYSAAAGTLVRTGVEGTRTLLSDLTSFEFFYFNEGGTETSGSPQSVKAVEFVYTAAKGTAASGTQAAYKTVSPRVVLRNKPVLE